jgi:hypothetical protein
MRQALAARRFAGGGGMSDAFLLADSPGEGILENRMC